VNVSLKLAIMIFFARTMDQFRLMQNSQVTDNISRWNIECQCAPDAQLTGDNRATIPNKARDAQLIGDNRATIPDKAQVVEPAHAEQVPVQSERAAEKTWQVRLYQLSHSPSFAPSEQLTDEKVVEPAHAEQVHLAQLSPSPSRERARLSQFAPGAQLTDEEAAALEEEDRPQIDLLDDLPQLVEAVARTPVSYKNSKRKKSLKLVKFVNLYEQVRSASDGRFLSNEHMDLYNSIYSKKKCADNKWIDWKNIKRLPEMSYVEKASRDIGLHELMAIKQNWYK
jgi:hypothetical protein